MGLDVKINAQEKNFSENARTVLEKRYLKKDDDGKVVESPEDLLRRVATNIAQADKFYNESADVNALADKFYNMMSKLEFLPNSPTLMNAGRDLQQLSACFVLPVEDSMESIFEAIKDTAIIHKTGGGTGFSFSRLRPKNSQVRSTGGISSGPVSFMKVFNSATQAVKQGGTRRGANMGILRIDHPDILEFIACKENEKEITNFNISIAITEEFMKKVETDEYYDLIDPHNGKVVNRLKAKEVFDLIVNKAWRNGEPGIVFIDRMNKTNPTPSLGSIESTNPCGEQPLLPYESCNLGSINMSNMVKNGSLDWALLDETTKTSVHFLDNVIDMNKYPLKRIEDMTKGNRKIGLGVMGFADMLIKLGVPYNSDEAISLGEKVMEFILKSATKKSEELANKRGAFPNFERSIYIGGTPLRNATLTTIAPTGTLSIIANVSSGIEPLFAISYIRNVMDKNELVEVNPLFLEVAQKRGFYSVELMKMIAKSTSLKDMEEIPEDVKRVFVTAFDISPEWHIKMQAAFQKYTHNAVSKTINFLNDAKVDDIKEAYFLAYKTGCKGLTVYRDKSREEQVLNVGKVNEAPKEAQAGVRAKISPRPRPAVTRGTTTKIATGCGNLYVTINEDDKGRPFEVFMSMGKAGGCAGSQLEAIGRLLSLALRSDIEINSILEQLRGIRCPSPSWEKGMRIFSCSDAIARVMDNRLGNSKKIEGESKVDAEMKEVIFAEPVKSKNLGNVVGVCPDCGSALRHEEGCLKCHSCGFSKC